MSSLLSLNSPLLSVADLQADYVAKKDLVQLIDETETSFNKINESIKTLIHVVAKQEKHLAKKPWTYVLRNEN